jgi:predicted nuclease with TOPRIM domain
MSELNKGTTIVVPAFRYCKELRLDNSKWEEAKTRMNEVQKLVPGNYSSLEFTFQEAWREARRNAIMTEDAVKKAMQSIEEIKADIVLTDIPKLLEEMPKNANNTDFRKAVISKNQDYKQANEHLEKLQAILAHLESNMKVMENTSRFLKKQMDYIIRSGGAINSR